jgi:micrococcal nuclease
MRRRVRSRFPLVAFIVAVLIVLRLFTRSFDRDPFPFDAAESYRVQRVVDGDTLLLTDGTRVRLLGVDTPETKHPTLPPEPLGVEASEFTRQHVEGRAVTLQFDRERRDRYHRVLAYVYLDDWMLNEELIRAGFSRAETRFPYSSAMKRRFRAAEKEARDNNRGLWANSNNRGLPSKN